MRARLLLSPTIDLLTASALPSRNIRQYNWFARRVLLRPVLAGLLLFGGFYQQHKQRLSSWAVRDLARLNQLKLPGNVHTRTLLSARYC